MLQPPLAIKSKGTAKDVAKLERGTVNGDVNFPAFLIQNKHIQEELQKFDIYLLEDIMDYPKHIPYTSEKKGFQLQTGRDSFELFQYRFRYNSNKGSEFVVRWDYNIGLVRITPFFKALDHNKTVPAKAIAKTEGLREMSHSITGGSLDAQGYWMPFAAARALAATFCWPIRYALTPLFGPGFPDICTRPTDPAFQDYKLSREVMRHCQEEVRSWTQPRLGAHVNTSTNINFDHNQSYGHNNPQSIKRRQTRPAALAEPKTQPLDNDITPKALRTHSTRPHYAENDSSDWVSTPRAFTKHHTSTSTSIWRAVNSPIPYPHFQAHSLIHLSASPAPSSMLFSLAGSEASGSGTSKRSYSDVDMEDADCDEHLTISNPTSPDMSRGQVKRRKVHSVPRFDDAMMEDTAREFDAAELEAARALVLFAENWGSGGEGGV